MASSETTWPQLAAVFGDDSDRRLALGMIMLATDRVSGRDVADFLGNDTGIDLFTTRVPMSAVATPETLVAMCDHLADAARVLVPGGRLDAIGFSCTSGSVAIGPKVVAQRIAEVWPGVPVTNPVDSAVELLTTLGARRIAVLVPYLQGPADLIYGYLEAAGFQITSRASFNLDGDPEMNRVSPDCLIENGARLADRADVDALFISCTGLRTFHVVKAIEATVGKPVVTSNQAHAWSLLRLAEAHHRAT